MPPSLTRVATVKRKAASTTNRVAATVGLAVVWDDCQYLGICRHTHPVGRLPLATLMSAHCAALWDLQKRKLSVGGAAERLAFNIGQRR